MEDEKSMLQPASNGTFFNGSALEKKYGFCAYGKSHILIRPSRQLLQAFVWSGYIRKETDREPVGNGVNAATILESYKRMAQGRERRRRWAKLKCELSTKFYWLPLACWYQYRQQSSKWLQQLLLLLLLLPLLLLLLLLPPGKGSGLDYSRLLNRYVPQQK